VARILVLLNIREGLREFLNLTDLGRTRVQILDYEGVPFRCRRCHEYGHIVKDCKSSMRGHRNNRSTSEIRSDRGCLENLGVSSPSSGSASVGTPPCAPVVSRILEVDESAVQEGDAMTLVPVVRDARVQKYARRSFHSF
jgi:hypothetical protein